MQFRDRMVRLVLIAILCWGSLHQPWVAVAQAPQAPAGCHEHGSKPVPAVPTDFHCCQAGHDTQILLPSATVQSPLVAGEALKPAPSTFRKASAAIEDLIGSSADPPGFTPLRI